MTDDNLTKRRNQLEDALQLAQLLRSELQDAKDRINFMQHECEKHRAAHLRYELEEQLHKDTVARLQRAIQTIKDVRAESSADVRDAMLDAALQPGIV